MDKYYDNYAEEYNLDDFESDDYSRYVDAAETGAILGTGNGNEYEEDLTPENDDYDYYEDLKDDLQL